MWSHSFSRSTDPQAPPSEKQLQTLPSCGPWSVYCVPTAGGTSRRGRTKSGDYKGQASNVLVSPSSEHKQHSHAQAGTHDTVLLCDGADAANALMAAIRRRLISGSGAPPGLPRTLRRTFQSEYLQIPGVAETLRRFADQTSREPVLGRLEP